MMKAMGTVDDRLYHLAFSHCLGIGPIRLQVLLQRFKSAERAYQANRGDLAAVIGIKTADQLVTFRAAFDPVKKATELKQKVIDYIIITDPRYPVALKHLSDAPICLYYRGGLSIDELNRSVCLAIVGTRRASSYGLQIARQFALALAQSGLTIVSGLALGIDTASHQGALQAKGKTVAVLGCGVDIVYPPSNRRLYDQICSHGLVISEFPPGHTVTKGLFVARNRIISGLSRAVVVIEGAKDSGALITARYAAEQGKEVFVPPVPLTSALSEAPSILIKQGATYIGGVDDIFTYLNLPAKSVKALPKLSFRESQIIDLLQQEPLSLDAISDRLKIEVKVLSGPLSLLELKGLVEKNPEGRYQAKVQT